MRQHRPPEARRPEPRRGNTAVDIPKVFGADSPEAQQLAADPDSFKDPETADYVGIAVHCARQNAVCTTAKGVKYGQSTATPTAVSDLLPDEPGGYQGFPALFGHRYVAPQLGVGTANLSRNGYPVTNAAGNLVDLNGNQINGAFLTNHPGFPGYDSINASQGLAYMPTCWSRASPWSTATSPTCTATRTSPRCRRCARTPRMRPAAGAPATSPRRSGIAAAASPLPVIGAGFPQHARKPAPMVPAFRAFCRSPWDLDARACQ
jgi:hypothetical protein